jgi:25S rRNA (uracil2843-N3)-methyltransferase
MVGKKGAASGGAGSKTKKTNHKASNSKQPKKPQPAVSSVQAGQGEKQAISEEARKQQQHVLDVFWHAFSEVLSSPDFTATMQSIKQALFDRDFAKAFGDPEHLAVYAARWSPTRALCYASVLNGMKEHLEPLCSAPLLDGGDIGDDGALDEETPASTADLQRPPQLRVLSIGGGAAELVAFGAFLNEHASVKSAPLSGSITLLDSGPWNMVVSRLTTVLTTAPPLSKYASAAAKLSNAAMVSPSLFTSAFLQHDALTLSRDELSSLLGATPLLITILFTLNELFTASGIGKTTAFLLDLTATVPFGSLLLVVDSPGSYSETSVGKEAKRYPMQWLLDRIMLGTRREPVNGRRWAKFESQDSVWFRLAGEALDYPIPLENMRYQMHLYRAEDASQDDEDDDN